MKILFSSRPEIFLIGCGKETFIFNVEAIETALRFISEVGIFICWAFFKAFSRDCDCEEAKTASICTSRAGGWFWGRRARANLPDSTTLRPTFTDPNGPSTHRPCSSVLIALRRPGSWNRFSRKLKRKSEKFISWIFIWKLFSLSSPEARVRP